MRRASVLFTPLLAVAVAALVGAALTGATATAAPAPTKAHVGFATVAGDDEIRALLEGNRLSPAAAYMWTAGLTGTHRTYVPQSSGQFLQEARAKSIESWEKSLRGNVQRLQRFAQKYTEDQVAADPNLQTEARSLLTIRSSLQAALAAARSGQPLVFAVEVAGDKADLDRLRQDQRVKVVDSPAPTGGKAAHQTLKPAAYQQGYADPQIQALGGRELYQRIKTLASATN